MKLRTAIDAGALAVLPGLGVLGFGPTFGADLRYLAAGFGGIVLGLGIAWLSRAYRWGAAATAGTALLAYLLLGSALAAPSEAIAGVIPSLESLRTLILGVVRSWKDLLTVAPPVGVANGMLIVPFLSALVCALTAGLLAWRVRAPYWTLLPVAALFLAGIAFGTSQASMPLLRGILLVGLAAAWLAFRRHAARTADPAAVSGGPAARAVTLRRIGFGAAVLAVAAALTSVAGPAVTAGGERKVLRDVVIPPVNLYDYPSPLMKFRQYVKTEAEETLFTVEGLPEGKRLRLAALDAYDGVVYNVNPQDAGSFAPVGDTEQLGRTDDSVSNGTPARVTVRIGQYNDVWLPSGGDLNGIELQGSRARELGRGLYYHRDARTALATAGLREGDSYTLNVTFPAEPDDQQLAQYNFAKLSQPRVRNDPPVIASKANELAGSAATPADRVRSLEQALHEQGFFSNGKEDEPPSLPGHGAARMLRLLDADQMIGDDEQYAVAMALMARKLGIPARVVMGFYPKWDEIGNPEGPIEIKGGDVHAWVEVAFDNVGWVAFDPTPDENNEPVPPQKEPKSQPKPQVLQPPPPPQEPAELPPDTAPEPQDAEQEEQDFWAIWGPLLSAIGVAMIPLAALIVPLLLIAWLKVRRRRRRFREGPPSQRVAGGWNEVLSLATDMGVGTNPRATRRESAAGLAEAFPAATGSTTLLARRADAGIFGPGEPDEDEVRDYWRQVEASLTDMTSSVGYWQRMRARYSPRSLFQDATERLGGIGGKRR